MYVRKMKLCGTMEWNGNAKGAKMPRLLRFTTMSTRTSRHQRTRYYSLESSLHISQRQSLGKV